MIHTKALSHALQENMIHTKLFSLALHIGDIYSSTRHTEPILGIGGLPGMRAAMRFGIGQPCGRPKAAQRILIYYVERRTRRNSGRKMTNRGVNSLNIP